MIYSNNAECGEIFSQQSFFQPYRSRFFRSRWWHLQYVRRTDITLEEQSDDIVDSGERSDSTFSSKFFRVPHTHRRVINIVPALRAKLLYFYCHYCHHCPIRVVNLPCTRCTKALYDRKGWQFRGYNRHFQQRKLADLTVVESISHSVSRHFYDSSK